MPSQRGACPAETQNALNCRNAYRRSTSSAEVIQAYHAIACLAELLGAAFDPADRIPSGFSRSALPKPLSSTLTSPEEPIAERECRGQIRGQRAQEDTLIGTAHSFERMIQVNEQWIDDFFHGGGEVRSHIPLLNGESRLIFRSILRLLPSSGANFFLRKFPQRG